MNIGRCTSFNYRLLLFVEALSTSATTKTPQPNIYMHPGNKGTYGQEKTQRVRTVGPIEKNKDRRLPGSLPSKSEKPPRSISLPVIVKLPEAAQIAPKSTGTMRGWDNCRPLLCLMIAPGNVTPDATNDVARWSRFKTCYTSLTGNLHHLD